MNRMTVLIALLGLALFAGCSQSDGSGSEWICTEGRAGNPVGQDWQCYSQLGWQHCSLKYVCKDVAEEEWFCDKLGTGRKYNEICDNQHICKDLADHYWACDSEASQATCEATYFMNPSDFFLCNTADRNRDLPVYWSCPDIVGPLPNPPYFRSCPEGNDPVAAGCTKLVGEEEEEPCTPLWSMDGRQISADPPFPGEPKNYCNPVACTRI